MTWVYPYIVALGCAMVRIYYILRQNVDTNVFSASVNIFIFVPGPIQNLTWLNLKT